MTSTTTTITLADLPELLKNDTKIQLAGKTKLKLTQKATKIIYNI